MNGRRPAGRAILLRGSCVPRTLSFPVVPTIDDEPPERSAWDGAGALAEPAAEVSPCLDPARSRATACIRTVATVATRLRRRWRTRGPRGDATRPARPRDPRSTTANRSKRRDARIDHEAALRGVPGGREECSETSRVPRSCCSWCPECAKIGGSGVAVLLPNGGRGIPLESR